MAMRVRNELEEGVARLRVTHDAHVKELLRSGKKVLSLLRGSLPRGIASRLARKAPRRLDSHYVDERHRKRQSDLAFEVFLKDGSSIIVVIEHKSVPVGNLLEQTYEYYLGALSSHGLALARRFKGDPVVITLVLYHGEAHWNPRVSWFGDRAEDEAGRVASYTLDTFRQGFRVLFINLRQCNLASLARDKELRAGLAAMVSDSEEALRGIVKALRAGSRNRRMVLTYILHTWNTSYRSMLAVIDKAEQLEGGMQMGKAWDGILAEGESRGQIKGEIKGRATYLVRLLRKRFGAVPKWAQQRIGQASLEELDAWFEQVLDAPSVEAALGSPR